MEDKNHMIMKDNKQEDSSTVLLLKQCRAQLQKCREQSNSTGHLFIDHFVFYYLDVSKFLALMSDDHKIDVSENDKLCISRLFTDIEKEMKKKSFYGADCVDAKDLEEIIDKVFNAAIQKQYQTEKLLQIKDLNEDDLERG